MNKKLILTIIVFLFFLCQINAQVKITIIDNETKQIVSGAFAKLQDVGGSSKYVSMVSDAAGSISFLKFNKAKYKLTIHCTGYDNYSSLFQMDDNGKSNIGDTIALAKYINVLDEVVVAAKKDFILMKGGKIIMNVAASPIAAGGNVYEALLRMPGITEQNNSLSFRSKSITVLLDGRLVNLNGSDLATMLANMPANSIEKIEVTPDPSAKYDAAGTTIIDLKLAKNKMYGKNGNITMGSMMGRYTGVNTGLNLNYRNKNVNVYGNYNYRYYQQYYNSASLRIADSSTNIKQNEDETRRRNNHAFALGTDYIVNAKNTIGILLRGNLNTSDRLINNDATITDSDLQSDSFSNVSTSGHTRIYNPSINAYYKSILDSSGKTLLINADYFKYTKSWKDEFISRDFDRYKVPTSPPLLLRNNSPANISVYSISADYTSPVKNGSLEAGIKSTQTTTDNDLLWEYLHNQQWIVDAVKTNHFIYKENINAAYINYSMSLKEKYEIAAGLRVENTNNYGNSVTLNKTRKTSYTNFFPNLAFTYNKNENNIFSVSYRKSIYRFGFDVVNPFIIYQSQYSYYKGNPDIKPEIDHNFDASYTLNQNFVLGVSYTRILKNLAPVYQKGADKIVISSEENLSSGDMFYFYNNWSKEFGKLWSSNLSTMVGFLKYNISTKETPATNANWVVQTEWENTFAFKHGYSAEFSASYVSPYASGIYKLHQLFTSDIGFAKSFLQKKINVKFSVTDLFNTKHIVTNIDYQGLKMRLNENDETRFARLQFTYKFGNKNVKREAKRRSGLDDLEKRVGN